MAAVWLIFLGVAVGAYWFMSRKQKHNLPPGPKGLPYIGNALQLDPLRPHLTLEEWAKVHGDVYTIKVWGTDIIVINGQEHMYDVHVKRSKDFAGRPNSFRFDNTCTQHNYMLNVDNLKTQIVYEF